MVKVHAFRLTKGKDLKLELEKYVQENKIKSGVIVSCVGSLSEATIRNATATKNIKLPKDLEIVSATGTFSLNGCHIHISLSDENLKTYGGHLQKGCLVNTTVEVVILELENYIFTREFDNSTDYKELVIKNNS